TGPLYVCVTQPLEPREPVVGEVVLGRGCRLARSGPDFHPDTQRGRAALIRARIEHVIATLSAVNRPLLEFLQVFGDELHAVHERRDLVVGLCPEPDVDPLVLVDPRGAQHGPGGQPEATTSIEVARGTKRL